MMARLIILWSSKAVAEGKTVSSRYIYQENKHIAFNQGVHEDKELILSNDSDYACVPETLAGSNIIMTQFSRPKRSFPL